MRYAEHPGDQRALNRVAGHPGREVDDLLLADGDPAGLVRGPQGAHHQPGGDQHQKHPGDAEEPAEVEFETAEVQPHADPDRRENSDGSAQHSEPAVAVRGLRRCQQEHRRFKAFLEHSEKGHHNQSQCTAAVHRLPGLALELALQPRRVAVHPDDHGGHKHHRDGADDRLHHFLLRLRQGRRYQVQADADADADQHRQADTGKHRPRRLAVSLEKGADDTHDERRL